MQLNVASRRAAGSQREGGDAIATPPWFSMDAAFDNCGISASGRMSSLASSASVR